MSKNSLREHYRVGMEWQAYMEAQKKRKPSRRKKSYSK